MPAPSANTGLGRIFPLPARVLTMPSGVIFLMRWELVSATNTFPPASTATPLGLLKEAAVPLPSANVAFPLPANVLTKPSDVIFLMRLLPWSATYKLPAESKATPWGLPNFAAVGRPSAYPYAPLPAKVLTTPPGVIFLMRWLFVSAKKILPAASTATPDGLQNVAAVPRPSPTPCFPLPAIVLTVS